MLNYILEPVQHPSLFQKYAHKRHLKVRSAILFLGVTLTVAYFQCSIFLKQWALVRWEEGTDVSLANALPEIKAEIRFERECEEM
jgi:G2/mitotic-specific cyclin 1/2